MPLRYVLIGIGEVLVFLAQLAIEMGVADRVHLLGHVSPEDLLRWYNACDVFAMPNRDINGDTEGFGMVFLEAAACGKAVLVGLVGGIGVAVEAGVTGLRVDGERLDAVVAGRTHLLGESGRVMGKNGYLRVVESFSWEQLAAKISSFGFYHTKRERNVETWFVYPIRILLDER